MALAAAGNGWLQPLFSPLVPLSDALAATDAADRAALRAGQALGLAGVRDRLGAYRHAGNRPNSRAVLSLLSVGIVMMLGGMLLRPAVMPLGDAREAQSAGWAEWKAMLCENAVWRFYSA